MKNEELPSEERNWMTPEYRAKLSEWGRKGLRSRWKLPDDPAERERAIERRREVGRFLVEKRRQKAVDNLRQPGEDIAL